MTAPADTGLATLLAIVGGLGVLIVIGLYVWYALALSRLFPRIGGEGWKGWVPILNEAEILARGGVPAWSVVFYFIPLVQFYGLYLKVVATHRINKQFGRGAGMTVLAILLPPVWATVLAWGAPPYPEGDRLAALQPGPRRSAPPAAAPARDASGYVIPSLTPHSAPPAEAPALIFPDYAAPPRPTAQADSPLVDPAPSVWGAPPQPPQQPFGQPAASGSAAAAFAPPPAPQPAAPEHAAPFTPPPVQPPVPPQPAAPVLAPQPPSVQPPAPAAPTLEQPPAPVMAPPVPPLPQAVPPSPVPTEAHPPSGIMATMGGITAPPPSAAPAPVAPERPQSVRSVPPSFRDGGDGDAAPQAPTIRPVPRLTAQAPVAEPVLPEPVVAEPVAAEPVLPEAAVAPAAAPVAPPVESIAPVAPPAPAAAPLSAPPAPVASPAAAPPVVAPLTGLGADVDKTVVTSRPEEDLDVTVVVARKRGVRRFLVLDDGRKFGLSGASVVIGRNPVGDPGEQCLAVSDTTRTLSKTHARLVVHDDEWRLTDLHATNGVVVVADDGTEVLLDPGESVIGTGRFILGEVGMHVVAERDS